MQVVEGFKKSYRNCFKFKVPNCQCLFPWDLECETSIRWGRIKAKNTPFIYGSRNAKQVWKVLGHFIPDQLYSSILDPEFSFIEFHLKQAYGESTGDHIAKVDKTLRNLFNGYSSEMRNTTSAAQGNETSTVGKSNSWSDWFQHISVRNNQVSSELDRYLHDDLFPCNDESFDILHWWKIHASQYPVVACMARDLFAVPASTVAVESAFGTSECIVNDHRTRLASNTIEALLCFQDWLWSADNFLFFLWIQPTNDPNLYVFQTFRFVKIIDSSSLSDWERMQVHCLSDCI